MNYLKLCALVLVVFMPVGASAQKMSAEELVAKHLESIGSTQKRGQIKNQVVSAEVAVMLNNNPVLLGGNAVLVSANDKNILGMALRSNEYSQDKFGFNGKDVRAGFIRPGTYSVMGGFIRSYDVVLREGLLGGTLFSSWALARTAEKKPKLSFDGTKKIDGVETYVLEYSPKGGSDLIIKMYFDTKSYRHVRTEYSHTIPARQGSTVDSSAGQSPDRYKVVEDFSDFQDVGGLTIPKHYRLRYSYSGSASIRLVQSAYRELEWTFNVTNFLTNQDIDDATFEIAG